jgi:molybdopterin converting factor small subunit
MAPEEFTAMKITVSLFATFRNNRFKQEQREYPEDVSFRQVVADLGLREEELGMALVNGRHVSMEQPLREGDSLSLFPLLGGG